MSTLELRDLEVAYGGVAAVRGLSLERRARRDRRAHRPERRRASRRRCTRSWASSRRAAATIRFGERVAPRPLARGDRAERDRARPGGAAALRRADRRGEPPARARRARSRRAAPTTDIAEVVELFPIVRGVPAPARGRALRRPAAAARDRARARREAVDPPARRAVARPRADGRRPRLLDAARRSASAGIGVLLVEQRAQRTVALADRTHVLANGELRLTLTPDDAADTDRMVAAYLS